MIQNVDTLKEFQKFSTRITSLGKRIRNISDEVSEYMQIVDL